MNWTDILTSSCGSSAAALERLAAITWPVEQLCDSAPSPNQGEPYGRTPLYVGAEGEVLLMGWRTAGVSAPHDHGGAGGFVVLLRGRFSEVFWRLDGEVLIPTLEREVAAPEIIPVAPEAIHSMASLDDGVSLHIYTPMIEGMRVYDVTGHRTLVVSNDCGAWMPEDEQLIITARPWE